CALGLHLTRLRGFLAFSLDGRASSLFVFAFVIAQVACESWGFSELEVSDFVDRWSALDDKRFAWQEVAGFDVLHEDAIRCSVDLGQAPAGTQHRSDVTRPAEDVFQSHEVVFAEALRGVMCSCNCASSRTLQSEQVIRKYLLLCCAVLVSDHEADGGIE